MRYIKNARFQFAKHVLDLFLPTPEKNQLKSKNKVKTTEGTESKRLNKS